MLNDADVKWVRNVISKAKWKGTSSPQYADCPHSYIIAMRCGPEWKRFADLIKEHGEMRSWRGYRFRYLTVDKEVFWVDFPALNRAPESSLDNGGYPSKVKK